MSATVGAYSLRALSSASALAVNVVKGTVGAFPPVALTSNLTTLSGQAYGNGIYTVTSSAGVSSTLYRVFDKGGIDFEATQYNSYTSPNATSPGLYKRTTSTNGVLGE